MEKIKFSLIALLCFGFLNANAFKNPETDKSDRNQSQSSYRMDCAVATFEDDLAINNVRARLLVGGDVWWDGNSGRYIVPKVEPGLPEVSSIFAGAVWLGGVDPAGNLKLAAKQYGTAAGNTDFWPGPLDPLTGNVDFEVCSNWDRLFKVTGVEIEEHLRNFSQAQADSTDYPTDLIPAGVKGWPAKGNEFFFNINNFELPNTEQGLGAFWDENGDGLYNPQFGDYPIIEIRGCPLAQFPDEMHFWIYNDAGGTHQTQGDAIQMEVQVQAFSYATNDELNDMSFMRYKLINRAVETIDSTYFAMWVDGDLGCSEDDYIGCDTTRSMMILYNDDAVDGATGCNCPGGVETYCNDVPILGVDYFRGPLAPKLFNGNTPGPTQEPDTLVELGMSSFVYINRGVGTPPPQTLDPGNAQEHYNFLTGRWRDGSLITIGGNGVGGSLQSQFVFPDEPNDDNGWSMCTANLPFDDRRTLQVSGPFRLDPGAVNELIIGVPWVPNIDYPCPDISRLQSADDLAQNLFDNCFDITDGPDAPDVHWVELDRKIVAVLSNDEVTSNNINEQYCELDVRSKAGPEFTDKEKSYVFEGYKVFQLSGPDVTTGELDDPSRAALIFQSDVKNDVVDLYNWVEVTNPTSESTNGSQTAFVPELKVEGNNQGIQHTFEITQDRFASGDDVNLVNHSDYYFVAIAYGYNEWMTFDLDGRVGQERPYLEGRKNIQTYKVTPRPIVNQTLNADYGDGADVVRLDGGGAGSTFLDISDTERQRIFDGQSSGEIYQGEVTYLPGSAPIEIKIHDPLRVVDGEYILRFENGDLTDEGHVETSLGWSLFDANTNELISESERDISAINEQIFQTLGFTISIGQTEDAGNLSDNQNGAIGQTIAYADPSEDWLFPVVDAAFPGLDFMPTGEGEIFFDEDPTQAYSALGSGHYQPFFLADYTNRPVPFITPAWMAPAADIARGRNQLDSLNNVDIVLTSNKDLWSRCIVVETATSYLYGPALGLTSQGNAENFELRVAPSVLRVDEDGDGKPDVDPNGGMSMAWFPGYAIDVETGQRLNIFFGENSVYGDHEGSPSLNFLANFDNENPTGSDMMFNPTSQTNLAIPGGAGGIFDGVLGGHHFIYVTRTPYDGCEFQRDKLSQTNNLRKAEGIREITWTSISLLNQGFEMLSYQDGLIPTETTIKLRVDNPYRFAKGVADNNAFPSYRFKIEGKVADPNDTEEEINEELDQINVVPNPYLAFSAYEADQFDNFVKITNLPAKCVVTIYSLNGQFIRQYNRDEIEQPTSGNNPGTPSVQINPDIIWDMKNVAGIPIASGVYLIHVNAEGLGERTIKWFGVNRKFDASGL